MTEDLQFQAGFQHAIAAPTPQPVIYGEIAKVPDNSSVSRNEPKGIDYDLQRRIHIVTTRIFEGKQGSEGFVVGLRLTRCFTLLVPRESAILPENPYFEAVHDFHT